MSTLQKESKEVISIEPCPSGCGSFFSYLFMVALSLLCNHDKERMFLWRTETKKHVLRRPSD